MNVLEIVTFCMMIVPHSERANALRYAGAIEAVGHAEFVAPDDGTAATRDEQIVLLVIAGHENGYEHGVPFGVCARFCRSNCSRCDLSQPLSSYASAALHSLRIAARQCRNHRANATRIDVMLGFFHTGHCRADGWSRVETHDIRRLVAHDVAAETLGSAHP
jgi:hypothetical protein